MASNNSVNSNTNVHTNVQIKTEPGTSTASANIPKNIKMEPGLPTTQRLTSFRSPRDLTLGGNIKTEKPKKVYIPNVNVQRNKNKKEEVAPKVESEKPRERGRGRGRGRGDRGRGKGNLIQSVGVWSEGLSASTIRNKRYGDSGDTNEGRQYLEKPKLKLDYLVDEEEEERKLKNLLRDDFIDDGIEDEQKDCPIVLPLKEQKTIYKNENSKMKVDAHSDEEDIKPVILETGKAVPIKKSEISIKEEKKPKPITISQILENNTNSYKLIRFPSLPGLHFKNIESKPNQSSDSDAQNDNEAESNGFTLDNLKSGFLGKLQILKSGKARLRIGKNDLIVDIGIAPTFHQDLFGVKIDAASSTGELINLGPINDTLLCSVDWETMLENL